MTLGNRRIGYARVSTLDQDPEHQIAILKGADCDRIYTDSSPGIRYDRPELIRLLKEVRRGDTVIVWKLDRLGRSLHHLIEIFRTLEAAGVEFRSLSEPIDTRSATGRLLFGIMASLAEFERSLISERTKLAALRRKQKNQLWGRRSQFHDPNRVKVAKTLLKSDLSRAEVARQLGITTATLYRWFPGGRAENFGEGRNLPPAGQRSKAG